MAGIEVGEIISSGGDWDLVSVASVVGVDPHPNADRLRLATVDLGGGERVAGGCGGPHGASSPPAWSARRRSWASRTIMKASWSCPTTPLWALPSPPTWATPS